MGQINAKMRRSGDTHFVHYCAGCGQLHPVPTRWTFNGDFETPHVGPSLRHSDGKGTFCHYNIEGGRILYHEDCRHNLRGWHDLEPLPLWAQDEDAMLFHNPKKET